jgi:hypothetical protein
MAFSQTNSSRMICAHMGLQPVILESQSAMNAVDGVTIERRIRISRPDEGRGRCKGSRACAFSAYVARPAAKSAPAIVVHPAAKRDQDGVTLILGHGAGAGQTSGFMVTFATGLAALVDAMKQPVGSELRIDSKPVHRFLRADGLEPRYGETMCSFWQWRMIAQHLRGGEVNFQNRARFQNHEPLPRSPEPTTSRPLSRKRSTACVGRL